MAAGAPRPWGHPTTADVIKQGYERAEADQSRDNEDPDLTADEAALGALWAKAHKATRSDECPLQPAMLRKGCVDYVQHGGAVQ